MEHDFSVRAQLWGKRLGFLFSYAMFTTILCLVITIVGDSNLTVFHAAGITLIVTLVGAGLRRYLR